MKRLNRNAISPRIGISALCVPLFVSLPTWATALATPVRAVSVPPGVQLPFSPASALAAPGPSLDPGDGTTCCEGAWLTEPTGMLSSTTGKVVLSSGDIEAAVDDFRALLGDPNNGTAPGEHATGRREINWDAVPAAVTNVVNFPNRFFNVKSPRGLVYDPGTRGLEVSDRSFTDINPTYAAEFTPFSGQKIFSPLGNIEVDVRFFVAGTGVEAGVRGIGIVFLDVDLDGNSGLQVEAKDGSILARIHAPARSDARGASFAGIAFRDPVISRVRIVSGNGILSPNEIDISQGGQHDLVVMDDFLYGEPTAN
jgi:hypothetical protein